MKAIVTIYCPRGTHGHLIWYLDVSVYQIGDCGGYRGAECKVGTRALHVREWWLRMAAAGPLKKRTIFCSCS